MANGLVFGGGLDIDMLGERAAAARVGMDQVVWAAPAFSLATSYEGVLADVGAQVVAMANRALRGNLHAIDVPQTLHDDVLALRQAYDYGFHADATRPANLLAASPRLARYLVDRFVLWGDVSRWSATVTRVEAHCDGIMLILGQERPVETVAGAVQRLQTLGIL